MAEEKMHTEEVQQDIDSESVAVEDVDAEVESVDNELDNELALKQAQLDEVQGKYDELNNRFLRVQADMDNLRRRVSKEREADRKYRAQSVIEEILPAIDNFGRALAVDPNKDGNESLLKGMEMVYRQLLDGLKKEGLEEIEAVGAEFDPHLHQAVMQVEDDNYGANIVVEELQKGYKLNDRVIRPSMVKVNQ
ncbi:nucleotide exchange factor GrpE [Bacillus solimangrovi]|uniref:Protein GrpE n=1 Tax=Bacillus solimangrovi TaxID=1305675 RepID=A0A1E5LHY5_9BACI|nr:nucleotide exchange factor GrpE [Bacillus solimangrovi]OEH93690.1 nucleotide exchange factor GrpE [Bacillus solimangrovi]